jgi:hypothetical protein
MDISKQEPSNEKTLKRRGALFVTLSKLLKGGNIEVNSMFAKEGYAVGDAPGESVVGILEQDRDAFGVGITRMSINAFGLSLQIIGEPKPSQNDTFNLGEPNLRWSTVYCVALDESSDERIKTNIEPLSYGLSDILKLQPIRFTFKESDEPQLGFSAQQVATVLPEVAKNTQPTSKLGTASLRSTQLIPVLVKAIQQQQQQITQLTTRVEELEKNP